MQTVFHLSSGDPDEQQAALAIAANLLDDDSVDVDEVAVVAQADGIEPVTRGGDLSEQVETLLERGVAVRACGNTLEMDDIAEEDLVEGVETVPTGGGELTRLQSQGYAYIRP